MCVVSISEANLPIMKRNFLLILSPSVILKNLTRKSSLSCKKKYQGHC